MKVRTLRILAAALGISLGTAVVADEPAKLKLPAPETKSVKAPAADTKAGRAAQQVDNQKLADAVAGKLTTSPAMMSADVQLYTDGGVVSVVGTCKDEAQKKEILGMVSKVDGVTLVRDGIKVGAVKQAQAIGGPVGGPIGHPDVEPMPLGPAGGGMQAPPLPNHAWPTYAPYPNMSRVAYPTAHPYNAFPFIGPYYPFPKVPLGWRSVTLSWEDGHWWLGRKQTPQDYWRVKFGY